jgi:hypothetical protein
MTGYVRTDTTNNIADGNVISAADLDNEFNGVQAAFNSSTGHTHDGSSAEGAPITKLGPVQDVTISTTVLGVKTTNTVDLGTSSLKFKDFYLAGNALIGGTLGVTSTATFTGAVIFNGNATIGDADTDTITQAASYVTGTQLKSAKTATNTLSLAAYDVDGTAYTNLITLTASNTPTLALTSTGVGTINNMSIGATTASTGAFTTLSANSTVTLSGGTINGVAYLNGSNVLTTGSALTFNGTTLYTSGAFQSQGGTADTLSIAAGNSVASNSTSGLTLNASSGSGFIALRVAGDERARLTSTSLYTASTINVGIGTSSPTAKLDVANAAGRAARIGGFQFSGTTSSADGGNNLLGSGVYWNGSNLTATGTSGAVIQLGNGAITFQTLTGLTPSSTYSFSPQLSLDSSGNLTLGDAAAGTNRVFNINGVVNKAQRIAFQESGSSKWLIGNGAASENGNFEIYDNTNGNNFIFTRTGNLGIGASPNYKLQVNGSADIINAQGTTANAFYRATSLSAVGDFSWGVDDSAGVGGGNSFIIYDRKNSAYRLVLNNSGNVGIGLLSGYTGKLAVNGVIATYASSDNNYRGSIDVEAGDLRLTAPPYASNPTNITFCTGASSTERARITTGGYLSLKYPTWNGPLINSGSSVSVASGGTINLTVANAGAVLICVYDTGSGNGGVFFGTYSTLITKIAGDGSATDAGSDIAVYKTASSHTITFKNRYATTKDFNIGIYSANALP